MYGIQNNIIFMRNKKERKKINNNCIFTITDTLKYNTDLVYYIIVYQRDKENYFSRIPLFTF